MWIKEPQKVSEEIEYLGTTDMCIYLLKGNEYMFVEGEMRYVVPTLLQQLGERGIDQSKIAKFLILHSHFDHCGIVPFFKRRLPRMSREYPMKGGPFTIYPIGNENFMQFQQSLAKLSQYDVEILCAARNGVFLEKDGREFISKTIRAAEQLKQEVIKRFAETRNRERITTELCDRIYAEVKTVDIPKGIFLRVIKSIVDNIVDTDIAREGG